MSRRPGIAAEWIAKYKDSVYADDKLVIQNNIIMKPIKYYDSVYDLTNHDSLCKIKGMRNRKAKKYHEKNGKPERLFAARKIKEQQLSTLRRPYENENVYCVR